MIPELARHLIDSGGKRLRPMLTLAAAQLCGYRGDGHVRLAAASSSCTPRRCCTTTWSTRAICAAARPRRGMVWGNQASVLVGDFLLGQAFRMMVEVGSLDALDILSDAAAVIAEGEVMQLAAAKNTETTEDDYLAGDQRQDGGAVRRRGRSRRGDRASRRSRETAALRSYGTQSRPRLPAGRRRARLSRRAVDARQERRRRFPRGQDHAAGGPVAIAAAPPTSARSGSARCNEGEIGRARSRRGHRPDEAPQRARSTPWSARAITARSPATRLPSSPTAR